MKTSFQYVDAMKTAIVFINAASAYGHDKYENQLMYNKINNDEKISSRQSNGSL
jgi:hypothetical protein